jgi:uncharacterized protein (TIGR03084 family)
MEAICDDLAAEHTALDSVLEAVTDWDAATPADGWSIRDTVSHLWFFDQRALMAITDPDAFSADMSTLLAHGVDASIEPGRATTPEGLMAAWQLDRARLLAAARALDPAARVPWYGPAMSARSFITARLMETWAHGQDVVDVVGVERPATGRLRHVAHIGVRARPYSYRVNDRAMPDGAVEVRLVGPDGDEWGWDTSSTDRVGGSALDFCLVVTQRRHLSDTSLVVEGPIATEWMSFAQAFAGPAGPGREPLRDR